MDDKSESEDEAGQDVKTPKNKKATATPQTFPKANKKVRLTTDSNVGLLRFLNIC